MVLNIAPEAIEFSVFEVGQILFVHVSFFFKGNVQVTFSEKGNGIPDVERNDQQLKLLAEVDLFVVQ